LYEIKKKKGKEEISISSKNVKHFLFMHGP